MGQRHRRVVGVDQQQRVQKISDLDLLVTFQTFRLHLVDTGGHIRLNALCDRHHIVHAAVFHHDQRHDNLRQGTGVELHIRVVGVDHGIGIRLVQKYGLGRIQFFFRAGQRRHTVDGPAALLDADRTEGKLLRLGRYGLLCLSLLRLRCLSFRCRRHQNALHQKQYGENQRKTFYFFHISPSITPRRGLSGGKKSCIMWSIL